MFDLKTPSLDRPVVCILPQEAIHLSTVDFGLVPSQTLKFHLLSAIHNNTYVSLKELNNFSYLINTTRFHLKFTFDLSDLRQYIRSHWHSIYIT